MRYACYLDGVQVGTPGDAWEFRRELEETFVPEGLLELESPACRAGAPMLGLGRGGLQFSSLTGSA